MIRGSSQRDLGPDEVLVLELVGGHKGAPHTVIIKLNIYFVPKKANNVSWVCYKPPAASALGPSQALAPF